MRLQIVNFDKESSHSFETFLQFGKIGEGHRCKGRYKSIFDCQIERTNSIAATIFIQKETIILFHWHITQNGNKIEDETIHHKSDDQEKLSPKELFESLLAQPQGRTRRFCPS